MILNRRQLLSVFIVFDMAGTAVSTVRRGTDSFFSCTVNEPTNGVFVNLNQIGTNQVASFRFCDGELHHVANTPTGGEGFPYKNDILLPDNPLGTQNALRVVGDHLFVVNAGSDSFSHFKVEEDMSLSILEVTQTQGRFPCSLDVNLDLNSVCVATCGGSGTLECYKIGNDTNNQAEGNASLHLIHFVDDLGIPVGQVPSGNPEDPMNPGGRPGIFVLANVKQVQFTPDGDALYMTIFDRGLFVYPTVEHDNQLIGLDEAALFSINVGDLELQHRPFSFEFQPLSEGGYLLHIQDPFATRAAELFFPPNIGIGLSAGGSLSTYYIRGSGNNTSFDLLSPHISAGQKGACWVAYNNGTIVVTNTASGTITVYRELEYLQEGIYDVAIADLQATRKNTGIVGFAAGPFATSGGSDISSLLVDVIFSHDGRYFYVLNAAAAVVDVFEVNSSENSIQNSNNRAKHVGFVDIPGVAAPTSDKEVAGEDLEWQRQIDIWGAWSGAAGIQGIAAYSSDSPLLSPSPSKEQMESIPSNNPSDDQSSTAIISFRPAPLFVVVGSWMFGVVFSC